jgi:hypothetical protein
MELDWECIIDMVNFIEWENGNGLDNQQKGVDYHELVNDTSVPSITSPSIHLRVIYES